MNAVPPVNPLAIKECSDAEIALGVQASVAVLNHLFKECHRRSIGVSAELHSHPIERVQFALTAGNPPPVTTLLVSLSKQL